MSLTLVFFESFVSLVSSVGEIIWSMGFWSEEISFLELSAFISKSLLVSLLISSFTSSELGARFLEVSSETFLASSCSCVACWRTLILCAVSSLRTFSWFISGWIFLRGLLIWPAAFELTSWIFPSAPISNCRFLFRSTWTTLLLPWEKVCLT